jgi:hypothetical protein
LRAAVRASGTPGHRLAFRLGIHHSKFSELINAKEVVATNVNVERLRLIADIVGFDRGALFLDGGGR